MKRLLTTAALVAVAMQVGMWQSGPAGAEDGMQISPDASRPAAAGSPDIFTGEVMVKPLFSATTPAGTGGGQVTFSPGARSAWHTHPAGQTLIVTSGTGWVQQWGAEKQRMTVGHVVWTPPGAKHWHGATDVEAVTHIAIQDTVDGRNVDWLEHVSDPQYFG